CLRSVVDVVLPRGGAHPHDGRLYFARRRSECPYRAVGGLCRKSGKERQWQTLRCLDMTGILQRGEGPWQCQDHKVNMPSKHASGRKTVPLLFTRIRCSTISTTRCVHSLRGKRWSS